jgi:hypothetical protein
MLYELVKYHWTRGSAEQMIAACRSDDHEQNWSGPDDDEASYREELQSNSGSRL